MDSNFYHLKCLKILDVYKDTMLMIQWNRFQTEDEKFPLQYYFESKAEMLNHSG
jgi:hypothetical protein